jgi:DNA-binding response OmpR family regulator
MQVLLVEDDVQTGKSIELMLRSLGHDCHWVEEGEAGVERATCGSYDVILLDIMLPGIDGYDVLQQLHRANVDTPVILQTGLVERDKAIHGLSLGVTDYLIKPYGKAEIAARIEAVLERAQHRASSKNGQSQPAEDTGERRRSPRVSVVKSGQIIYRAATCVMDSIILDLSDRGAALQPEAPHRLPASFRLKIHHGPTHHCEVCWRYRNKLGVRFLDT